MSLELHDDVRDEHAAWDRRPAAAAARAWRQARRSGVRTARDEFGHRIAEPAQALPLSPLWGERPEPVRGGGSHSVAWLSRCYSRLHAVRQRWRSRCADRAERDRRVLSDGAWPGELSGVHPARW